MNVLGWITLGLITGVVGKSQMPGRDAGGFLIAAVLGMVGALVGGVLGRVVGWYREGDAVAKRLAPICVMRFKADPGKALKLKELTDASSYEKSEYVKKQGWATMPGEEAPDSKVADECVKLLAVAS